MKVITSLYFFIVLFFSCGPDKKKDIEASNLKISQAKSKAVNELISKYHVKDFLDSISYAQFEYSIDFKTLTDSQNIIVDEFLLDDIFQIDSQRFVSISTITVPSLHLDFELSEVNEQKIRQHNKDIVLVVNIFFVKKIQFPFSGEIENEEVTINLDYTSFDFIGKGKIVDIISLEKPQKSESSVTANP